VADDDIAGVAQALISAGAIESVTASEVVKTASEAGFEKLALALNRSLAAVEIESMEKIAKFCANAQSNGYSDQQIAEALQKLSAATVKKHLGTLVAVDAATAAGKDKNVLDKKHTGIGATAGNRGRDADLTLNMGTGL